MWDLPTIRTINAAVVRGEDNFSRHCSFSGDADSGIVLHSAKQRSTMFLEPRTSLGGALRHPAANFLRRWNSVNSVEARDRLVESYFS